MGMALTACLNTWRRERGSLRHVKILSLPVGAPEARAAQGALGGRLRGPPACALPPGTGRDASKLSFVPGRPLTARLPLSRQLLKLSDESWFIGRLMSKHRSPQRRPRKHRLYSPGCSPHLPEETLLQSDVISDG